MGRWDLLLAIDDFFFTNYNSLKKTGRNSSNPTSPYYRKKIACYREQNGKSINNNLISEKSIWILINSSKFFLVNWLEVSVNVKVVLSIFAGSPMPTVTWSSNGQILSSTMLDLSFSSALNSKLIVRNLSRIHHHTVYTCQASNFHKKIVSTNVTIELYRKYISSINY